MNQIRPYEFQEADVRDLLAHGSSGFIVAETGAGKTVIGAETLRRSGARTKLIIAMPGTIERVWRRTIIGGEDEETGEWVAGLDPEASLRRLDSSAPGKDAMSDLEFGEPGYYIMTHQIFARWRPEHLRVDAMLVDEAHLLGNRDRAGGMLLKKSAKMAGSRMVMSGTMARNRFENLWTLNRFVYPDRDGDGDIADISPNRWIDNFCATEYDYHAPGNRVVVGELYPGTVANLIPCWRQHFKREHCCEFHPKGFLANLPEPVKIRETVELTGGQRRAMAQMQKDYLAHLQLATDEWLELPPAERKKKALVTKLPIVRETRLSQMTLAMPSIVPRPWKPKKNSSEWELQTGFVIADDGLTKQAVDQYGFPLWDVVFAPDAESPKLDALIRIFERVQEPIVAATNSKKFAELAVNRLNAKGIRAFEWSSSASESDRDAARRALTEGQLDIIVGVTEAIGTGIDGLQDASGVLVSLNKSRDLTSEVQLEGRLDRRGQRRMEGVIHYEIIAEGSTDVGIIDSQLERRLKLNRSLRRSVSKGVAA